ncbi:hypothetical protein BS47DRAFT_1363538 [Hydnum rufescens UP504]|uniref:Uncharacterized protein n=1 Tax=Hydnum rufescens UP504 TaxID=1448309 RepID=A0A9P6DUQ7_9AGAM|nr:hypothetical protein BS47DRAFT_1363538 [Hydnum rufescens UP504]
MVLMFNLEVQEEQSMMEAGDMEIWDKASKITPKMFTTLSMLPNIVTSCLDLYAHQLLRQLAYSSNNVLLHWFPLADKAVEPIPMPCTPSSLPSPLYTHESLLIMGCWSKSLKPNLHMRIAHHVPSLDHEDVLYHPAMHECIAIPPQLWSLAWYLKIIKRLDKLVGDYIDPFLSALVTTFQFISIWTKFAPAQYHTSYFLFEEDQQECNSRGRAHTFVIDWDSKLTEQLWTSKELKKLMMANKLLKLWAELTLARLYKLRKLHQGESLLTPMASEDLLPPTPELREWLHKVWHDPCLPTKKIARRAVAAGWEALEADIDGVRPIVQATRHPFSGNQAAKYREYNFKMEEAFEVQPLPWIDTKPYGLGLFVSTTTLEEQQASTSHWTTLSLNTGPGSILNVPTWPTPPSELAAFSHSSNYRASSFDLESSPPKWQEVPFKQVSTLGEGLCNALWTLSKANLGVINYLINQAESAEGGARWARSLWNAATNTPTLPAPGVSRAHGYYAEMVSAIPTRLPVTLFPQEQATAPIPFTFLPMKGLLISQASNGSTAHSGPLYARTSEPIPTESKGKGPMPPPSCPASSKGSDPGPSRGGGSSGSPGQGGPGPGFPPSGGVSGV